MNKKNKISESHASYKEWLFKELKNPEFAQAYLNEALQDEDQRVFLIAIKDVLEAQEADITAIAEQANLNRQNIYRMLSKKGNPRWDSLTSIFKALDLQVHLSFKK